MIIASGFAAWWAQQQNTISNSLLSFVPATYDQMLYSIPDDEMFAGLQKVGHIEALSGTQELLTSTNEIAIRQYVYNEEPLVLLFLDARSDFSFEKAAQM